MHIEAFGITYYLDEKAFVERMVRAQKEADTKHPWRVGEIVEYANLMWVAQNLPHSTNCSREDTEGVQENDCAVCEARNAVSDIAQSAVDAWKLVSVKLAG